MAFLGALIKGSRRASQVRGPAPETAEQKGYLVREFERDGPDQPLVPVRQYRTIYHANGTISTEELAMERARENR